MNVDSKILSTIKLTLFEIATGPVHNDFYVDNREVLNKSVVFKLLYCFYRWDIKEE